MERKTATENGGYNFDFDDDEHGILTEQSDLLLSDDGIVYDSELMQLYKTMQGPSVLSPRDDGSLAPSQDSHPPDDFSLDLTDELEDELGSVSAGGAAGEEDAPTPVPPASDATSLAEFQELEAAMRRSSLEERPAPKQATEDERLDEFLRDAEKSHVDYSQLLQSQRNLTPTSEDTLSGRPRPGLGRRRISGDGQLPVLLAEAEPHRDSADFEVADISDRQPTRRQDQSPSGPPPGPSGRQLPSRPPPVEEEDLEMVNAHRRLDADDADPIALYDQLRVRMDASFAEEKRRRPESGGSSVSADTVRRPTAARRSAAAREERPGSGVEQWLMEQHQQQQQRPRSGASERNGSSRGSGIGPLRPAHRAEAASSKQDSVSSCDSDDLGSLTLSGRSESKTALKQRLKQEKGKVQQQADQIEVLKSKYGQLLTKHALAEVTIDQLRVNAKVNLDYQISHSLSDLSGSGLRAAGGNRAQSVMEKPTQTRPPRLAEEDGGINFHSLPPSPNTTRGPDMDLSARRATLASIHPTVEPPPAPLGTRPDWLQHAAGELSRRLDAFSGLIAEDSLPVADQEEMVARLREEYDSLHRGYEAAQMKADTGFDVERSFEGDLFQLGMRLDDLGECVQSNVRRAKRRTPFSNHPSRISRSEEVTTATSATTPSTHDARSPSATGGGFSSGHSTGMSTIRREGLEEGPNVDLGDRLTDLEDQYLRLMSRYNELKGKMTTPERDSELESLMKELTNISEEAAGLSQVISTPHELAEQFRFDQEASILDQELEQAAAEEQQQAQQQQMARSGSGRQGRYAAPDGTAPSSRQSLSRQGSHSSAGIGLRSEDLEWSSTATTAVQRRGSRSGYTTGTTGGNLSEVSGASSRAATHRRPPRHPQRELTGSRSSAGDSGLSTPVNGRRAERTPRRVAAAAGSPARSRGDPMREWSAGTNATGPSDISTASTVTQARRAARRSSSVGAGGERRRPGAERKRSAESQERRPISGLSIESGQSTRLRSLEQDVHWLKEQLTGSQLSLGEGSTHSGLNLDRYDPESSLIPTSVTPDESRSHSRSRRRRARSQPANGVLAPGKDNLRGPRADRERPERSRGSQRRSRHFADALDGREMSSDELLTSSGDEDEQVFASKASAAYRRRYEPPAASGPPILKPLRPGDDVSGSRGQGTRGRRHRRHKRGRSGMDGMEEEEEEPPYDPYQRYMSEPFALRRERNGFQFSDDDEESSSEEEDWRPRGRRSAGTYAYNVPPAPGRGILRPPGHSPMLDDFLTPPRRRSRSRSPGVGVAGGGRRGRPPVAPPVAAACPLCGSPGLHGHGGQEDSDFSDDDEPVYPLREYLTQGTVRYYVREYSAAPAPAPAAPKFAPPSRNMMRTFSPAVDEFSDVDREVRSINKHRLNESLSDAIRAARSMSRVASKVRESLKVDVSRSLQRRWTPLPAR